jgi:hypothetical protein
MKSPLASWFYDASLVENRTSGKKPALTTPVWKSGPQAMPYDASVALSPKSATYDGSAAKRSTCPQHTMATRLFGRRLQCQLGRSPKNLTMPV